MSGLIEYGVRATVGGEETTLLVGNEVLQQQVVAEFLESGHKAEPLIRTVSEWAVDQTAKAAIELAVKRDAVIAIGIALWDEVTPIDDALKALADLGVDVESRAREEQFLALVKLLEQVDGDDSQAADEQVNAAAEALVGAAV